MRTSTVLEHLEFPNSTLTSDPDPRWGRGGRGGRIERLGPQPLKSVPALHRSRAPARALSHAAARHEIGVNKVMWGSDYPHPEGAWPWSRESLRRTCAAMPETELRSILGGNAVSCYGMDAAVLESAASRVGPTVAELTAPPGPVPSGAHLSWAFRSTDKWT